MNYAYVCPQEHAFDEQHPMGSAPTETTCPTCNAPARRSYKLERKGIEFAWKPALGTRADRVKDGWGGMTE